MDEIIVRVFRTVACPTRLRVVSRLATGNELTPTELARDLRLRPDLVSAHLGRLASAGIVQRRRSGARCYCTAQSPYGERALSGQVAVWLRHALMSASGRAIAPAPDRRIGGRHAEASAGILKSVFDAATAFTHPRRIMILRRLAADDAVGATRLGRELHMSEAAVTRHVAKLIRRGYVRAHNEGHRVQYRLAPEGRGEVYADLLEIVRAHWGTRRFHT